MSVVSRTTLKSYFEAGDKPTEAQFIDLIDTLFSLFDDNSDDIAEGSSHLFMSISEQSKLTNLKIVESATIDTGALSADVTKTIPHGLDITTGSTILQARDNLDSNNVQVALLKAYDTNNIQIKSNVDLSNLKVKIIGIKA